MKASLVARVEFIWGAIKMGTSPIWVVVQIVLLIVGGSGLAYLALALNLPWAASAIAVAAIAAAGAEGAFLLHREALADTATAQEHLADHELNAPKLKIGKAQIPKNSQPYVLPWGAGDGFTELGRVIRVPVSNAGGSRPAENVQAQLTFQPDDVHSTFSPKHPVLGEWAGDGTTAKMVDLPGNGHPALLEVLFIRDRPYPHSFVWTEASRSAALSGHEIKSTRVTIKVEVSASGGATATDKLIVELQTGHSITANLATMNRNEEGDNIEWWEGHAM